MVRHNCTQVTLELIHKKNDSPRNANSTHKTRATLFACHVCFVFPLYFRCACFFAAILNRCFAEKCKAMQHHDMSTD
eukprot:730856-Amphidinium_carterae.1